MAHSSENGTVRARIYAGYSVNARGNRRDRGGIRDNGRELPLRSELRVAQEHLSPRRGLTPAFEDAPIDERPAVEVVIDVAGENESVDQRRMEKQFLKPLERSEPDQVAAGHADKVLADVKMPVLVGGVDV